MPFRPDRATGTFFGDGDVPLCGLHPIRRLLALHDHRAILMDAASGYLSTVPRRRGHQ